MGLKLKNNAVSVIPVSINDTQTSITVVSGTGVVFPSLGAGDYFYATISSVANAYEVVKVTARATDTLTIERAQEGTTALSFPASSRIELRVTVQNIIELFDQDYLLL
jgi:hypothetical protein